MRVEVTGDGLAARLYGRSMEGQNQTTLQRVIVKLLRDEGIKHGIQPQALREAVEKLLKGEDVDGQIVAVGKRPQEGRDASIEVKVSLESVRVGRQTASGHIDFRDKGPLPVVEAGTPLAVLTPEAPGQPGITVRGERIEPPKPHTLKFRKGHGVNIEQDGRVLVAAAQGMVIRRDDDHFEIREVFEVKGDVDFASGHVDFPGVVKVDGAVLSDFKVRCYDLEVGELEPRSQVEVRDNLVVRGGIMGSQVKVGGKVVARFIRDTHISCKGDVVVENEIVQSIIEAEGKVTVTSSVGRVVNSKIFAVRGVTLSEIVSTGKGGSVIQLGVRPEFEQAVYSVRTTLKDMEKETRALAEAVEAQSEELVTTENDLRGLLAALKDPAQQANRENLLGQVNMIKPMRETLKEGVAAGRARLEELDYELERLSDKLIKMEAAMPSGHVWLNVRTAAGATTEIRGPRANLTLTQQEGPFSAREVMLKDKQTGQSKPVIQLGNLRSTA
ncbi:hypothetical protein AAU61_14970 [Desulfocarbo indianensis]|nr:hypothetical protein AAU61_14970 [Desulfocarbo indianensis]